MKEIFVSPPNSYDEVNNLEDQSIVVSLAPPNLLQDAEQKQKDNDNVEENEELTTSCESSEPLLHNAPNTPTENTGNADGATLMEGENYIDVQTFSTNHDDLLDVPCDKYELCDNASVFHALELNNIAENKHVMHIASANDELKLLSFLNTIGYIDFDVLCNLRVIWRRKFFMCCFVMVV